MPMLTSQDAGDRLMEEVSKVARLADTQLLVITQDSNSSIVAGPMLQLSTTHINLTTSLLTEDKQLLMAGLLMLPLKPVVHNTTAMLLLPALVAIASLRKDHASLLNRESRTQDARLKDNLNRDVASNSTGEDSQLMTNLFKRKEGASMPTQWMK